MFSKIRIFTKSPKMLVVVVVWCLASILVLVINPASRKGPFGFGPPASMTTFQETNGGYSISYPRNWSAFSTLTGSHGDREVIAVILVAGKQMANVTIVRRLFADKDINSVLAWGQSRAERQTRYEAISLDQISEGRYEGFMHDYSWETPNPLFGNIISHCQDAYLLVDDSGYDLSFCSIEKDWSSLEDIYAQMLGSLTIEDTYK